MGVERNQGQAMGKSVGRVRGVQEHVLDGRIALSPGHVGGSLVFAGPVFHVHAGDPVVLCFNEGQQRLLGLLSACGYIMAKTKVDGLVGRLLPGFTPG